MIKSILVIDDQKAQAEGIAQAFKNKKPDYFVNAAWEESDILIKIESLFYNVAIIDLRMDNFTQNGFSFIRKIVEVNPFAKIIIVSAYASEYSIELTEVFATGKIAALLEKTDFDIFISRIFAVSDLIVKNFENNLNKINLNSKALTNLYVQSKMEIDSYKKGKLFEDFTILLFSSMGFNHIYDRVIDKSRNEVDIIIRNEIKDDFINKFGSYLFIECKNKVDSAVSKNDFIVFLEKVRNSNGLSKLGIILTTGYIASTTYLEAMRSSKDEEKIIFLSNPEIEKIISSDNYVEEFKKIIDIQVKDHKKIS